MTQSITYADDTVFLPETLEELQHPVQRLNIHSNSTGWLRMIMQGKIKEKIIIGRKRILWLHSLRDWFRCSSVEIFRPAANSHGFQADLQSSIEVVSVVEEEIFTTIARHIKASAI